MTTDAVTTALGAHREEERPPPPNDVQFGMRLLPHDREKRIEIRHDSEESVSSSLNDAENPPSLVDSPDELPEAAAQVVPDPPLEDTPNGLVGAGRQTLLDLAFEDTPKELLDDAPRMLLDEPLDNSETTCGRYNQVHTMANDPETRRCRYVPYGVCDLKRGIPVGYDHLNELEAFEKWRSASTHPDGGWYFGQRMGQRDLRNLCGWTKWVLAFRLPYNDPATYDEAVAMPQPAEGFAENLRWCRYLHSLGIHPS